MLWACQENSPSLSTEKHVFGLQRFLLSFCFTKILELAIELAILNSLFSKLWFMTCQSKSVLFCKFIIKIGYFENHQIMIKGVLSQSLFICRCDFTRSNVRMQNNSFGEHFKLCIWFICWNSSENNCWLAGTQKLYWLCIQDFTFRIRQWWF